MDLTGAVDCAHLKSAVDVEGCSQLMRIYALPGHCVTLWDYRTTQPMLLVFIQINLMALRHCNIDIGCSTKLKHVVLKY